MGPQCHRSWREGRNLRILEATLLCGQVGLPFLLRCTSDLILTLRSITKAFVTEWVASCPHEKHQRGKRRQEPVFTAAPANVFPGPLHVPANPLPVHAPAVPVVDDLVEEATANKFPTTGDEGYASEVAVDGDQPMEELFDFESASEEGPSDVNLLVPIINWNKCH